MSRYREGLVLTASRQSPPTQCCLAQALTELRVHLADRAYDLDCRGQAEAADLANEISAKLEQLLRAQPSPNLPLNG